MDAVSFARIARDFGDVAIVVGEDVETCSGRRFASAAFIGKNSQPEGVWCMAVEIALYRGHALRLKIGRQFKPRFRAFQDSRRVPQAEVVLQAYGSLSDLRARVSRYAFPRYSKFKECLLEVLDRALDREAEPE